MPRTRVATGLKMPGRKLYLVVKRIDLSMKVRADSLKEAEGLADDLGESRADSSATNWRARRIRG